MIRRGLLPPALILAILTVGCSTSTSTMDEPSPPSKVPRLVNAGGEEGVLVNGEQDRGSIFRVMNDYLEALAKEDYDRAFKLLSDVGRIGLEPNDLAEPRVMHAKLKMMSISHLDRRGATWDVIITADMLVDGEGVYKNGENQLYVTLTHWSDRGWLIDKIATE